MQQVIDTEIRAISASAELELEAMRAETPRQVPVVLYKPVFISGAPHISSASAVGTALAAAAGGGRAALLLRTGDGAGFA